MRDQIKSLKKANKAATTRRKYKKKRIQQQGTLTKAEAEDIIAQQEVEQQLEGETRQGKARLGELTGFSALQPLQRDWP